MKVVLAAAIVAVAFSFENVALAAAILLFVVGGLMYLYIDRRLDALHDTVQENRKRIDDLSRRLPPTPHAR